MSYNNNSDGNSDNCNLKTIDGKDLQNVFLFFGSWINSRKKKTSIQEWERNGLLLERWAQFGNVCCQMS